jgi:hypothetical protein
MSTAVSTTPPLSGDTTASGNAGSHTSNATDGGVAKSRTTALALLHASPGIGFIGLMLWTSLSAIAWTIHVFLGGSLIALAGAAIVVAIPGCWASWHLVRMGIEAERYPD